MAFGLRRTLVVGTSAAAVFDMGESGEIFKAAL